MKRYTKQWEQLKQRRNQVSEDWLSQQCSNLTANCRRDRTPQEQAVWEQRDRQEQAELAAHANAATTSQENSLPGRQTGSEGWRAARGELGSASSSSKSADGTAYKMAHDAHVASRHPDRLCEGVVRASGEHVPQQTAVKAFDGSLDSKWLDFGGANGGVTWLEYRLLPSQPASSLASYSLTSAEDEPSRDPCDFVLEGSLELATQSGEPNWRHLDKQQGVSFEGRHQTRTYTLDHPLPCRAFRLRITAVKQPASANSVQLAKLDLHKTPAPQSTPPSSLAEAVFAVQEAIKQAQQDQHAAMQKASGTLLLVLSNIAQQPNEQKFRTLKLANPRIQDTLSTAIGLQVRAVLEAVGFKAMPRQCKQPPEAMLFLDRSDAITNVLHALALLQRPTPSDQPQAHSLGIDTQLQPDASQQQAIIDDAADASEQARQGEQSSTSVILSSIAVKTDDTVLPPVTAEPSKAPAAASASTVHTANMFVPETPAAPQRTQQSSMLAQSSSGTAQEQASDATPAQAQAHHETPAAPQRQHKPNDFSSVATPMERLQLQTPSAAAEGAASTSTQGIVTGSSTAQAKGTAVKQTDVKTLIQQEFARLMATKQYAPNQAATLAVQNLSKS